jgi:spermidine/putrescine transport system substrate-binding protein
VRTSKNGEETMCNVEKSFGRALPRRTVVKAGLAAGLGALAWPKLARADGNLNVLAWCDHADARLIEPFAKKHGVQVNVKTYEGTGTGLSIIAQSQPGDWDVFMVDATDVPRIVEQGIFLELPEETAPWSDMFPQFGTAPFAHLHNKLYAVPEKFGYYGVCFNKNKVDAADASRGDIIWNAKYKSRVAVYDYYFPLIQMVALQQGWKPGDIDAAKLATIREKLLAAKPNVKLIGDIVSVQNALVSGDVDAIYGGAEFTVANLIPKNPQLDWVIEDSGGLIWTQGLTVLKASKRQDLALEFIKWVMSPDGQGLLATSDCYWGMPTNSKSVLDDTQKGILRWNQQPDYLTKSVFSELPASDLDQKMLDIWTEFLQA